MIRKMRVLSKAEVESMLEERDASDLQAQRAFNRGAVVPGIDDEREGE